MASEKQSGACVIVGASFAGLCCGLALSQRGHSVRILEKKADVGFKLRTTGIIVRDAVDQIPLLDELPEQLTRAIPAVRLYSPSMRSIRLESPGYYFLATDTPGVLRWLADKAARAGAEICFESPFSGATRTRKGWDLGPYGTCQFLVGADGAGSPLARSLGLGQNKKLLYGIEHEYRTSHDYPHLGEPDALHCFASRKIAPGYIAWIVQGVNHIQAGLAGRGARHRSGIKTAMATFLEKTSDIIPLKNQIPETIRAGAIPCGGLVRPLATTRAILVGDAAGMVSPVTAGGIHTAIRYGLASGHAIADCFEGRSINPSEQLLALYPRFRARKTLRVLYDHFHCDWPFNMLLSTRIMRRIASRLYFHR
ncbi:MAG TPA: NAD(P)/FAD-dependent oxidoreductase [Xanthomonadales bacterium]|nr:NAD(P)/FAD-dependent oxidoreductase [Xanthomonadales bacterium]